MAMTALEKDKIMSCTEIMTRKFQQDQKAIEAAIAGLGDVRERAIMKINSDMLTKCINKISDDTTHSIFTDLVFQELEYEKAYDELVSVDYALYNNFKDLEITPEQQILLIKLEKIKEEYIVRTRQRREDASKQVPPIFGFDINAVPVTVKVFFLIGFFAVFALG